MDLQVHRGRPGPEEIAALVVALAAVTNRPAAVPAVPAGPRWSAPPWAGRSWTGLAPAAVPSPHTP